MDILKKRRSAACKCSVAADVSYKEAGVQQGRILKILKSVVWYKKRRFEVDEEKKRRRLEKTIKEEEDRRAFSVKRCSGSSTSYAQNLLRRSQAAEEEPPVAIGPKEQQWQAPVERWQQQPTASRVL
ncbi:hypothetical protein H113_03330 [Trichophyton rubrum MR1459]|uniref:Uncharacterized protein n=2 Tax=Trichophyton TaxID=5550 RepID=A0A022W6G8_TRIRU|nr:hypothetical protein H100_03321 [Trichophyton rubrum MR850]EZF43139.1 hypothetical protein H102_03315 [Trichophyton rubrum CBS 100081]EZF53741.1 hypothetical protein H103_03328 [Trichophyton rubrum CBS 288.86]EZF64363.1 hypothetical protein H104_03311 [Trichophyton rubrum CBS 289.86]EZF75046.1 hypothetical protein H105_03334 [Trichophyton soudanense CBS 452.61]EZF85658.1 hypothetical protein H110_03322 [Trichophyton rubrum MR1448]EZF96497.1 hypothetical protein H113_03330 [Trichophyton rub